MTEPTVAPGDVIQINPDLDSVFGGCLMLVTEVRGWGVVAVALVPAADGPRQAPYRAVWSAFARVGPAAWPLEGS